MLQIVLFLLSKTWFISMILDMKVIRLLKQIERIS